MLVTFTNDHGVSSLTVADAERPTDKIPPLVLARWRQLVPATVLFVQMCCLRNSPSLLGCLIECLQVWHSPGVPKQLRVMRKTRGEGRCLQCSGTGGPSCGKWGGGPQTLHCGGSFLDVAPPSQSFRECWMKGEGDGGLTL